ncbi:MAG: hypothetical protein ACI4VX_07825, partial [Succinivibrionaceae bacterium]
NFSSVLDFSNVDVADLSADSNVIIAKRVIVNSLKTLTRLLNKVYGRKSIILIDEYDVPLQKAQV